MRFSQRTAWETEEDAWTEALRRREVSGLEIVNLANSNPTACGLGPQTADYLVPLAAAGALRYAPDALGMPSAREAVARYYADKGVQVPVQDLCLTTSTSEGYSFLFRLLCDAGDEVLIGRPSYPLFDLLARLDDVALRHYPMFYEPGSCPNDPQGGWSIDLEALEGAITERTRAVIVVHPNNPTGNYAPAAERSALRAICARHGLALIADEVFLDYPLTGAAAVSGLCESFAAEQGPCLGFVLSGLSKVCAMPQAKLSWIVAHGPEALVRSAMERLEVIADTFLSVSGPTQFALPAWLAGRHAAQRRIQERIGENLAVLDGRLPATMANRLASAGGWTVVLRTPAYVHGEEFARAALESGVAVQPGDLYGMPAGHCVLSLLTAPEEWRRGLALLPIG